MSKTAEEYSKEFDAMYGDHKPNLPTSKAEQRALEAYPITPGKIDDYEAERDAYTWGYEQAEKDLGWISVKDRLPEEGHFVLTCVADTGTPQCVGMALLLKDGTWWDGDMKVCVDYWMEVPKLKK